MKRFTVAQAEALIPQLEQIFAAVFTLVAQAQAKASRLKDGVGDPAQRAIESAQVQFLSAEIERRLQEIIDWGAVPKGIDPALVDFPARIDGKDVFLCWQLGEKSITTYHGVQDGFTGRQPLPRNR